MKYFLRIITVALLVSTLALTAFGFRNLSNEGPNEVERNYYEYQTPEEIIKDREKVGKNYTITTLTIKEYEELIPQIEEDNAQKVEAGQMTEKQQKEASELCKKIYNEADLGHGFIKKITRTDGSVHYKYHSKLDYYEVFGETNTLFYVTQE